MLHCMHWQFCNLNFARPCIIASTLSSHCKFVMISTSTKRLWQYWQLPLSAWRLTHYVGHLPRLRTLSSPRTRGLPHVDVAGIVLIEHCPLCCVQSGAAGCEKGFVNIFWEFSLLCLGSMAAAVLAQGTVELSEKQILLHNLLPHTGTFKMA